MPTDYAKVKEAIEKAFSAVEYPGDEVVFIGVEDPEMIEGIDRLRGKHWRDVTPEMIKECRDCFLFLPIKSFHFYLPAFMLEYLNWDGLWEAEHNLIGILTRPSYELEELLGGQENFERLRKSPCGPRPKIPLSKERLLHKEQAQAIALYLQYAAGKEAEFADMVEEAADFWDKTVKELVTKKPQPAPAE